MEFVETMSDLGKMKRIAVCISGEIRTWKEIKHTWNKLIRINNVEVDFFIHTWDTVFPSSIFINEKREEGLTDEEIYNQFTKPVDEKLLNQVLDHYKPVNYLIESPREFKPKNREQTIFMKNHLSQYYGIMKAGRLKREYEIENDFMYDLVIRARFDIKFDSVIIVDDNKPETNVIYGNHYDFYFDEDFYKGRIGDMFWCSDSLTYDILSDFYMELPNMKAYPQNTPPEFTWFNYIKKNQIKIIPNSKWYVDIFRGENKSIV